MNRLIYILASLLAVAACGGAGTAEPVTPGEPDDVKPKGYYIYVDKTVIEADGIDVAAFTIKDQDDRVVSVEADMGRIWYENVATSARLDRYSTGFSSIVDGEWEFAGLVGSERTLNTVTIKVQNRARYEVFHKNVAVFKLTGTWCTNCPSMTSTLNALDEDASDHSVVLACHWNDGKYSVKYQATGQDLAASAALHVNPNLTTLGVPSNVYDLAVHKDVRTVAGVTNEIMQRRIDSPATTGIKITSVALDGTDLKVTASVKAGKAGEYDLTCAVLADNVNAGGAGSADGLYHHMVISVNQANFMAVANDTKFNLAADAEFTREFIFPMGDTAPGEDILANLSVAVLSLKKGENGRAVVDNVAQCAYGKTVDYRYN